MNEIARYRGYDITFWAKPIPDRRFDYDFVHRDYDEGDRRHGSAASVEEAKSEIDLIEDEDVIEMLAPGEHDALFREFHDHLASAIVAAFGLKIPA